MAKNETKTTSKRTKAAFASRLLVTVGLGLIPALAQAQDPTMPAPAASVQEMRGVPPTEPTYRKTVAGHIGIATPFVTVADQTTTIADDLTILNPIGVGVKISERWVVDVEVVVATRINQGKTTGLVIDPGIIYNWGPVATGLRVAWEVFVAPNVGLIPLINRGLYDMGGAMWFVEAAFPTFYSDDGVAFNAVLHTGIGF
jgi:hypothetical protein